MHSLSGRFLVKVILIKLDLEEMGAKCPSVQKA
jgi:hypothetical protein